MSKATALANFAAANAAGSSFGFKNRLINGAFDVWQRGTARFSNSAYGGTSKYYADRWSSGQYQNAAFERVERSGAGPTAKYAMRVSSSSAAEAGAGTRMTLGQLIEHVNCVDLAGQPVTLSFWIRFSAASLPNYGQFAYSIWEQDTADLAFDTNGPTRYADGYIANGSLPTVWTKYTLTVTTASTMKNLAARFGFQYLATTASNGSLWYEVAEVQLEEGPTATAFDFRSIGQELALCQRYYQIVPFVGTGVTTGEMGAAGVFKVTMRTPPSLNSALRHPPSYNSSNNQIVSYGVGPVNVGSAAFSSVSADFFGAILCTGLAVGAVYGGSTTASAEL